MTITGYLSFLPFRSTRNSISFSNYSEAQIKIGFILSFSVKKNLCSSIKTHEKATRISVFAIIPFRRAAIFQSCIFTGPLQPHCFFSFLFYRLGTLSCCSLFVPSTKHVRLVVNGVDQPDQRNNNIFFTAVLIVCLGG